MRYIVHKKARISGKNYLKGDIISSGVLSPYECGRLVKYGFISELTDGEDVKAYSAEEVNKVFVIPVYGKDETIGVVEEELKQILLICQMLAEEATAEINAMENCNTLNAIMIIDPRKGVTTAAAKRLKDIADAAETSDNPETSEGHENADGGDE